MSNFQARVDEASTAARHAIVANSNGIRDILPTFYSTDFERLIKSISGLLEKVDKARIDHPEYLAHSTGNVAEYAAQLIEQTPNSFDGGSSHFVQTTLPSLLLCEERLAKAVGNYYYKVKDIRDRQVREIQKLAEDALGYRENARKTKDEAIAVLKEGQEALASLKSLSAGAQEASKKIDEVRALVIKLASGDGRGKSLEALKRTAESKLDSIDDVLAKAVTAKAQLEKSQAKLDESASQFHQKDTEVDEIRRKAEQALGLSNQAGLANSYLQESRKLTFKSYVYTAILYLVSGATALVAAKYVIPSLTANATHQGVVTSYDVLFASLLRATILAPLIYVIYFTTKQISSLETLRMDYAEKAAASLAYSGYKGEMSLDPSLLEKLQASLLLKFAEHPERLLRKQPAKERISVRIPGFEGQSSTDPVPTAAGTSRSSAPVSDG